MVNIDIEKCMKCKHFTLKLEYEKANSKEKQLWGICASTATGHQYSGAQWLGKFKLRSLTLTDFEQCEEFKIPIKCPYKLEYLLLNDQQAETING